MGKFTVERESLVPHDRGQTLKLALPERSKSHHMICYGLFALMGAISHNILVLRNQSSAVSCLEIRVRRQSKREWVQRSSRMLECKGRTKVCSRWGDMARLWRALMANNNRPSNMSWVTEITSKQVPRSPGNNTFLLAWNLNCLASKRPCTVSKDCSTSREI